MKKRILLFVSTMLVFLVLMLSGCQNASKSLSPEEVSTFNTDFFNSGIHNMNNMLLSSEYSSPEGINLFQLFYGGVEGVINQISEEEKVLLTELCSEASYLDIIKVTTNDMNTFLQEKLGMGLEKTQKVGLDDFYYLEEYDSYYLVIGDTNFDWCTVVSGTWESNNTLVLTYEKEYDGGQWIVTLQKTEDGYVFISNRKVT